MSKAPVVRVALIQQRGVAPAAEILASTIARIHEAADRGAQIICTQELFLSPYFCQTEDHACFEYAEPIPGPTTSALAEVAKQRGVVIVGSLFEKRAAGLYHNTAVVLDADGSLLGIYRKMHIPDDPLFYEKFYFTPGDLGFRSFRTRFGTIGVLICWDQWYPEGSRLTALQGAQILFYPTAIGWHPSEKAEYGERQHGSWETIQRSHAIANGVYVAAPNRVGFEATPGGGDEHAATGAGKAEGIEFWGQSFVADPSGQIMTRGSVANEEIIYADCDLSRVDFQRTHWPFLRDRRIDAYGQITSRYID
ncbi:MAG: carbon-nitrogen hydrolase [Planctomycetaceae bacterium]